MFPHVVWCSEEAPSRQQGHNDTPVAQRVRRRSAERQSKQHAVPYNRLPIHRRRRTPAAGQALDRHEQVSDSGRSSKTTLGTQSPSSSHARSRSTTPTVLGESSTSSRSRSPTNRSQDLRFPCENGREDAADHLSSITAPSENEHVAPPRPLSVPSSPTSGEEDSEGMSTATILTDAEREIRREDLLMSLKPLGQRARRWGKANVCIRRRYHRRC